MKSFYPLVSRGMAIVALLATTSIAGAADVTYERLSNPEPENWLTNNRTYDGNRYSPLEEINKTNVKNLKLAFAVPLAPPSQGAGSFYSSLQGTPLVDNGIMYMSDGWGRVYRIDLTAGDRGFIDWIMDPHTDPEIATGIMNNRGVALYKDAVYSLSPDGRLIATDAATGEVRWEVETQQNPVEYFSMAPLVIKDKILIGPAGGDGPMRGRIEARNPENGDLIWTFNTVPGKGEPGNETWEGNSWETGGVATWVTGSYDKDRNELIWGLGNPNPAFEPKARPGDNLYSDSTVALDADTGKLKWHFQYTPNDGWDFDEVGTQQLYKANINGKETNVVGHFGRNGFFYNLDGTNGAYLNGSQYLNKVTWTKGIDPKTGKPVEYDPNKKFQTYIPETRVLDTPFAQNDGSKYEFCPYWEGGVNMFPTTYSPKTGLVYGVGMEGCTYRPNERPDDGFITGTLVGVDIATGEVKTRADFKSAGRGGTVSTAGGLVFGQSVNGDLFALDDTTMERLWNINLGTMLDAPPITFAINGKQYLAVAVGPGGVGLDFHKYASHSSDEKAAAMANFQRSSTLYFFSL